MTSLFSNAHLDLDKYRTMYQRSLENPNDFWGEQATRFISWFTPWKTVLKGDFNSLDEIRWFEGGELNACYNCIDRHLPTRHNQIALIWEGNESNTSKTFTYGQLHEVICKFANVLLSEGIQKGDRVCIYLPMIPEALIAMLACARIGAIHSVVFAGFSSEALKTRLLDASCCLLITADEGLRGEKRIPLKYNTDEALQSYHELKRVIVVKHTGCAIAWDKQRDRWYHDLMSTVTNECSAISMQANDPLFILYTSGSTGQPKGVLHSTGGYLVYAAMTHYYVFDYHEHEVYWCTADVGWITGHTYNVYGPLANGATVIMYEGSPHYPTYARYWEIIDKHHVNIFYTAPTAVRALRREGDELVKQSNRRSLRLLGTVGEPMNPEVWEWYYQTVGEKRCPIVDTWWQTETGGILLTPLPGVTPLKPGSVGWPFFGIDPAIVNDQGVAVEPTEVGNLVIKRPWPGFMQSIYHNRERFIQGYFHRFPGTYLTGDGAVIDEEGCFTIIGRTDDVIKVSGHRIGTGELESALLTHHAVAEAAVVGVQDALTGEAIVAYISLKPSLIENNDLKTTLIQHVRHEIGAIATIQVMHFVSNLPKTRSGKIMRRVLRKIASHEYEELGDLSTLADMDVVAQIIKVVSG